MESNSGSSVDSPSSTPAAPHSVRESTSPEPKVYVPRPRLRLQIGLLLATIVTCTLAWHLFNWEFTYPAQTGVRYDDWISALGYTAALLAILLTHEAGHYLQAVRYKAPATLPFVIPFLYPFGTMGAVIFMDVRAVNRKQLFDIGLTGPWAGLAVAVPLLVYGIWQVEPVQTDASIYGEPLLYRAVAWLIHGQHALDPSYALPMSPAGRAAWIGLFITGLNMLPVGQLDGGHVTHALLGPKAAWISRGVMAAVAAYTFFWYSAFFLMVVLILLTGLRHPPSADDTVPLGRFRTALGYFSLTIPLWCLTPTPILLK